MKIDCSRSGRQRNVADRVEISTKQVVISQPRYSFLFSTSRQINEIDPSHYELKTNLEENTSRSVKRASNSIECLSMVKPKKRGRPRQASKVLQVTKKRKSIAKKSKTEHIESSGLNDLIDLSEANELNGRSFERKSLDKDVEKKKVGRPLRNEKASSGLLLHISNFISEPLSFNI